MKFCWVYFVIFLFVDFQEEAEETEDVVYTTPKQLENAYVVEAFDDSIAFDKKWIKSQAKKEGVDEDIAKYNGK